MEMDRFHSPQKRLLKPLDTFIASYFIQCETLLKCQAYAKSKVLWSTINFSNNFFFHLFFFFFYYQQKLIDYFRIIYKKYLVILKSSIFLRWINTFFNKINCALFSKIISWNYEKILRNWTVLFSSWERERKLFIRSILQIIKKQRIVQIISSNLFSFKRNKSLQKYQSWKSQGNKTTTIQPHSLPIIPKKKKRKNSNENTSQEKLKILKKMKQLPLTLNLMNNN